MIDQPVLLTRVTSVQYKKGKIAAKKFARTALFPKLPTIVFPSKTCDSATKASYIPKRANTRIRFFFRSSIPLIYNLKIIYKVKIANILK